jgi:hypothetical protein
MAISNRVADSTLNFLYAKLVDTVVTGNRITSMFLSKAKPWAGAQIEIPIKWQVNPNSTSFSGADTLSTTAVDNTVKMTFDAKFNNMSVVLPITDLVLNDTPQQVANLLYRQVQSDAEDFALSLASQLYSDGTGNSNKDLTGLGAAVDDGTSVATYGGLSRTTYPTISATVTASGGTLTLAKMYTLWDTVMQDSQQPTKVLTTKAIRSLYEQLLIPNIRYADASTLSVGAKMNGGLQFRDADVVADSACTAGVMFMLNEKTFDFYSAKKWPGAKAVNYSTNELDGEPDPNIVQGLGFFETEWREPINQQMYVKNIVHGGNLVCRNPRYNGKLTGITGI